MTVSRLIIAIFVIAAIALSGCPSSPPETDAPAPEPADIPDAPEADAANQEAPAFEVVDVSGTTHSLSEYRGEVLVMYFWATYCIPCCEKLKKMQAMHEAYSPRDVQFLGLSLDPSAEIVAGWKQEHDVEFPLIALEAEQNKPQEIRKRYFPDKKIIPLPQGVIINPEGEIAWTMGSELTLESLEAGIKQTLQAAGR